MEKNNNRKKRVYGVNLLLIVLFVGGAILLPHIVTDPKVLLGVMLAVTLLITGYVSLSYGAALKKKSEVSKEQIRLSVLMVCVMAVVGFLSLHLIGRIGL